MIAITADEVRLRGEALRMIEGRGAILETAREVSALLREAGLAGAVIGGVAVVLHGHRRATDDVDVYVEDAQAVALALAAGGFDFDADRREFVKGDVPVHLVKVEQLGAPPRVVVEIEGVTTVSLVDLIEMKLRSGGANLLRAQDLADVIGLARRHALGGAFAGRLAKDVRPAFRKIAKALKAERESGGPGHP